MVGLGFKGGVLGFGEESTWGTAVSRTNFVELNSGKIVKNIEQLVSGVIPKIYTRSDEFSQGGIATEISAEFDMRYEGLEKILKHALGEVNTEQLATGVYQHTFKINDDLPTGLTFELDEDVSAGVLSGGKITNLEMSIEYNNFLKCSIRGVGKDKTYGTKTTPTLPSGSLALFSQGTVKYDGNSIDAINARFSLNNNLKTDRRFIGSQYISEPQRNGKVEIVGSVNIEFDSTSKYTDFVNANSISIILEFLGAVISGDYKYKITINFPLVKITSFDPNFNGQGVMTVDIPFKAYATSNSNREMNIVVVNTLSSV